MLILFISNILFSKSLRSQSLPNWGIASEYAILSGDSINSSDFVNCKGLVGSTTFVSNLIFSDDTIYENSTGTVDSALQDASDFFAQASSLSGTNLLANLNGDSLVAGNYYINGNTQLTQTLDFYGDSTSVFIIKVNGNLNFDSLGNCRLFGIKPGNIFWIIDGDIIFNGNIYVYGNFISNQTIILNGFTSGLFSLIAFNQKVIFKEINSYKRLILSPTNLMGSFNSSPNSYQCTTSFSDGLGGNDEQANDITVDISENIIITGHFNGTCIFNGNTTLPNASVASSIYNYSCFITKYNPNYTVSWARQISFNIPNVNNVIVDGMRVRSDNSGNIIVLGSYTLGPIEFVGSGVTLNSLSGFASPTIFIAKYDPLGNLMWAQNVGFLSAASASGTFYGMYINSAGLDVDKIGNIYTYTTAPIDITLGIGTQITVAANPLAPAVLCKFDPNGDALWAVRSGEWALAVAVDGNDNVYIGGLVPSSSGSFYNYGISIPYTFTSPVYLGAILAKYNSNGLLQYATNIEPTNSFSSFIISELKVDCNGNAFACGYNYGSNKFNSFAGGSSTIISGNHEVLFSYSFIGNYSWNVPIYGVYAGSRISLDGNQNIYCTGTFINAAFHTTPFYTTSLTNEIFTAKYDNIGNLIDANFSGGQGSQDFSFGIEIDRLRSNSFICGLFQGITNIGNTNTVSLQRDIFVAECVTPTIIFPVNAGTDVTICKYSTANLSGTGIGPFQWYENGIIMPGATTQNLSVTPLTTSTYTFQAYGADGCQYSDDVVVTVDQGCCFIPGIQSYTNPTFSSSVTNQTFIINGTATIQGNVTFSGCTVLMGPYSTIQLDPGSIFTLDATTIQACNDMWQGISMTGLGSEFASDNSSRIEDANNAVFAPDPRAINIHNTTFDRNLVSLNLNNGNFTTFALSGNSFLCSGGYSLHFPNTGQRSSAHILLNNVQNITIGDAGSGSNTFDNADAGISCNQSGMAVYNNIFQNITFNTVTNLAAAGILCKQGTTVTIGGINPNEANTFTSNLFAIEIIASQTVNVVKNNYANCGVGVFPLFNFYGTINITDDNTMTSMANGITAIWNPHAALTFTDNHIQTNNYAGQKTNGIGIAEIYSLWGSSSATVQRNVIHSQGYYGFFMQNSANGFFENNRVYMDQFFPPDEVYGFRMDNSFYNTLSCNEVDAVYYSAGDKGQNKRGFTLFDSPKNTVDCNTSDKNEIGFQFMGNNPTTSIKGNEMHKGGVGLALGDVNNYVVSSIDPLIANGTILPGNKWYNNSFDTYNYQQPIVPALWTKNGSGNPDYPSINSSIGGPSIVPFVQPSYNLFPCPTCSIPLFIFNGNDSVQFDINMAEQIAQSQLPIMSADAVTAWKAMRQLFEELDLNQNLLESSAVLEWFYDSLKTETIGKLALVKRLILQTTDSAIFNNFSILQSIVDSATGINNSIVAFVLPEYNEKLVNSIYLNSIAVKRYILNQNELSDLLMVANQCIFEGGPAVISARVFLNSQYPFLHFDDAYFCNSGSNRFADQNNNDYKTGFIKCYPNPASNNLLVEFKVETESVLYVFDNIGRQVISLSIDKNNHFINLDVSKLSNGHYLLRIANLNCSLTGKFNIKK